MGLFDNIAAPQSAAQPLDKSVRTVSVTFTALPETLEQFKTLPQAALCDPFGTAALTVLALCFYPQDRELCHSMLNFLKGLCSTFIFCGCIACEQLSSSAALHDKR